MGWRWLSAGQLLRDSHDPELISIMQTGDLVSTDAISRVMGDAIGKAGDIEQIILDGFPRNREQAQWLIDSQPQHGRSVGLVVVLEVPREELLKRLAIRGRVDDTPEVIDQRLNVYRQEMYPILSLVTEQNIPVVHIDGVGSVGEIHDRIFAELKSRELAA